MTIRTNTQYRTAGTSFTVAEDDQDRYDRDNQLTALAVAVEEHNHEDGRGLPVARVAEGAISGAMIGASQVSDVAIGNRTIDQTQVPSTNVGVLSSLLSWIANRIVAITGASNWYDNPAVSLNALATHGQTRHAPSGPDPLNLSAYQVWTALNDGPGSGLDADKIDGVNVTVSATAPSSAATGDIWIDTSQ